ncbi:MAG: helix-turn-helix domain-containing protein [Myxococcota bacterium]
MPLWSAVLDSLEGKLSRSHIRTLTDQVLFLEGRGSCLRVALPAEPVQQWMSDGTLSALIDAVLSLSDGASSLGIFPAHEEEVAAVRKAAAAGLSLHPNHRLEGFFQSAANETACNLMGEVSRGSLAPPGPLILTGPRGSGKTHLLEALAAALVERGMRSITCVPAPRLSLRLVDALWSQQLESFRSAVHSCEALLIDELEALSGRDGTQDELTRAIGAGARAGRLVVLAAQAEGDALPELGSRLRSILEQGTRVDLAAPEWELRVAIAMDRARRWGGRLAPQVASFLVGRLDSRLVDLDSVVTRVIARSGQSDLAEIDQVRRALELEPRRPIPALSVAAVQTLVAKHYGLRARDLRSASRSPRIAVPRQIAMYLTRRHCGLSYPEIGQRFGRHHTTVLHACRRVESQALERDSIASALRLLEKEIEQSAEELLERR